MATLTSKTFVRKTKRGAIQKIVREHYLRDDICCGLDTCKECVDEWNINRVTECDGTRSTLFTDAVVLVPDIDVTIHQIDVLEDALIKNVVIIQTVIEELRRRNPPVHKRLRELISNPDKHFYVFSNEFHKDTYVERRPKETRDERNVRSLYAAIDWLTEHTKNWSTIQFVRLTNDRADAAFRGRSMSVQDYVASLPGCEMLLEKISQPQVSSNQTTTRGPRFPEHLSLAVIHQGIKVGRYIQGTFRASRENYLEGYVTTNDGDSDENSTEQMVFIEGLRHLNRAIHSDIVAVEMLPEDEWTCPSSVVLDVDVNNEATGDESDGDMDETDDARRKVPKSLRQPSGRIVGIIRRNWRQYCGILQPSSEKNSHRQIFVAAERRVPKIRLETRQAATLAGQRIVVAIDSWPRHSRYPQGHFVRTLGELGDKDTENEVLLLEHDIPHTQFSQAVLSCLPSESWRITEEDMKNRADLRHLTICSVDPPGCTDIDDALHCRVLDNGNMEVGVHIADVSHFIRPGTAIDREAAERGTTVYLTDQRIDMVPELLSSNLCSLRSQVDRLAFSVLWEVTAEADIVDTKFTKSVIASKASLTYAEAQIIIDDPNRHDDLAVGLRSLNKLAKILKQNRVNNGALSLASTEIRFNIDSETHDPIDVDTKQLRDTNSMVEEFMLLANVSVAEKILSDFPDCSVLRRHPAPPPSNFDPVIKAAESMGFRIDVSSSKALAESLDRATLATDPYFNTMLRIMTTRCMMQAVYFCSGMLDKTQYVHYGLASPIYTHFTSPIRRYSDIMVHRLLAVSIGAESTFPDLLKKDKSQNICNGLNYRHKMAQYAGRASVNLHTQLYFKHRIVDEAGYVLFVRKNALQILVPKFGLEGTVYLNEPRQKSLFTYNEEGNTQHCGGHTIQVFDPVTVRISIDQGNAQRLKLCFKLVKPEIPGFSVPPTVAMETNEDEPVVKKAKKAT